MASPKTQAPAESEKPAPSQTSKVRWSAGEWESGRPVSPQVLSPKASTSSAPALTHRTKPKQTLPQEGRAATQKMQLGTAGTSPKRYASRLDEAKAWNNKAKIGLANSRNLKTDIKQDVTQAIERLYQIVKEAEAELTKERKGKGKYEQAKETNVAEENQGKGEKETGREDYLAKKIEENTRLLLENGQKIKDLKDAVEKQKESFEKATYASVAAASTSGKTDPEQAALHSVVVSSTKEEETGEEVLEKVRRAVDAKEGWIQIERVRKAKDRKVIMGCKTEQERRKIKERLEAAGQHLVVEEVTNKDPLIILRDVLSIHSDEEVIRALKNQNKGIFTDLQGKEDKITVKYRRKARNPHNAHIVLCVSPKIWRRATEAKKLRIDLQQVKAEDQSPLVQCTRCLGFGHGKRFCKEPADLCSHCGGLHLRAECPDRLAGEAPACKNCIRAKMDTSEHNAFSMDCPIKRRWDSLARASVAYC